MNPRSFLSNFWGSLHYDTPSLYCVIGYALIIIRYLIITFLTLPLLLFSM